MASAAASNGGNKTVAIVDAYDDPNAASDLAAYRSTYGLPPCGPGCFTKFDQNGGTSYPTGDSGWAEEIGSVSFTATGLPTGVTAAFSPTSSMTRTTLTLKSPRSSPTGPHAIKVTGTSGSLSASSSVNLTLNGCFLFC